MTEPNTRQLHTYYPNIASGVSALIAGNKIYKVSIYEDSFKDNPLLVDIKYKMLYSVGGGVEGSCPWMTACGERNEEVLGMLKGKVIAHLSSKTKSTIQSIQPALYILSRSQTIILLNLMASQNLVCEIDVPKLTRMSNPFSKQINVELVEKYYSLSSNFNFVISSENRK
jgi:hypothetical protein